MATGEDEGALHDELLGYVRAHGGPLPVDEPAAVAPPLELAGIGIDHPVRASARAGAVR
jgi:hypothetical protein